MDDSWQSILSLRNTEKRSVYENTKGMELPNIIHVIIT